MTFLLTPAILTGLYFLTLAAIHYRREKDLLSTLPYLLEKKSLYSVTAFFLAVVLGKLFLTLLTD